MKPRYFYISGGTWAQLERISYWNRSQMPPFGRTWGSKWAKKCTKHDHFWSYSAWKSLQICIIFPDPHCIPHLAHYWRHFLHFWRPSVRGGFGRARWRPRAVPGAPARASWHQCLHRMADYITPFYIISSLSIIFFTGFLLRFYSLRLSEVPTVEGGDPPITNFGHLRRHISPDPGRIRKIPIVTIWRIGRRLIFDKKIIC